MGKFSEWRIKNTYKKEGRLKEYEDYRDQQQLGYQDINMRTKWLNNAIQRFESIQEQFPEDSKQYIEAKYEVDKWKHSLEESKLALKFIRPNSRRGYRI